MSEYLERIVDNLRRIAVEEDAALARGVVPPIYTSGNVEGGTAKNVALEERYFGRVKHL